MKKSAWMAFVIFLHVSFIVRSLANTPSSAGDSLSVLASRLYGEGEYQKVVALNSSADSSISYARLSYYQGMSYAQIYDYPHAQTSFQKALLVDSQNVNYHFQYGRLLLQAGFIDGAITELAACMRLDSMYLPASFQLGLLYNSQKTDPRKEAAIFSFLLRQNSSDFLSCYYLGDALRRLELLDSAMIFVDRSIALNPQYFPSLIAAAHYHDAAKHIEQALALYQKAEAIRPRDKDLLFSIGECLRKLKEYRPAIGYFQRAIAIDSTNAYYHTQLGYAYYSLSRFDSAIAAYRNAVRLDADNPVFYSNLALAYEKADSTDAAVQAYQQAIAVLHGEQIGYMYNTLAGFYSRHGMYREAAAAYEAVYKYNPKNIRALYWAGDWYAQASDMHSALQAYENFDHLLAKDSTSKIEERKYLKQQIEALRKKGGLK